MSDLEPTSDISNDLVRNELHFAVSGLWQLEQMGSFLRGLTKYSMPLVESGKPIHVLGDMTGFVAQTRETSDAIRDHLLASRQFAQLKVAIFGATSLVRMQYKRLSEGVEVGFFDSKVDAVEWLRSSAEQAA